MGTTLPLSYPAGGPLRYRWHWWCRTLRLRDLFCRGTKAALAWPPTSPDNRLFTTTHKEGKESGSESPPDRQIPGAKEHKWAFKQGSPFTKTLHNVEAADDLRGWSEGALVRDPPPSLSHTSLKRERALLSQPSGAIEEGTGRPLYCPCFTRCKPIGPTLQGMKTESVSTLNDITQHGEIWNKVAL